MLSGESMHCIGVVASPSEVLPSGTSSFSVLEYESSAKSSDSQGDDFFAGVAEVEIVTGDSRLVTLGETVEPRESFEAASSDQAPVLEQSEAEAAPVPEAGSERSADATDNSQADISNVNTQQLTQTLHAANGPPSAGSNLHLTPDSSLDLAGNALDLGADDVLSGTGTIFGDVSGNGHVRPGNSPGHITVTNYSPGPGMITEIEIQGLGQGTQYDWLEITGAATLDGTIKILFSPQGGYVPALGQSFDVLTWGSNSGTEFANWLGTASIPGHANWAFQPEYKTDRLTLTIVQTPVIAGPVGTALTNGLNTLSSVADSLDDAGEFAESIPFIGSDLGALSGLGTAIQAAISNRLASFPNPAQVAATIESWDGTSFAGFTFAVRGVLAHYGTLSSQPMWWDVNIELTPAALNDALDNVAGAVFGAVFTGAPSVSVQGKVMLDFAFGYDSGIGGFFAEVDSIGAAATVNASGLNAFGFSFNTPAGVQGLSAHDGTVNLTAAVTATPDESILTGGRITQATLATLNAANIGNAFNLDDSGTLNAAFPLTGTLSFGPLFTLTGTYTVRVQSDDLLNETPDVTVDVNSTLGVMGQTIHGDFTLKNTGTETIIEAANVNFQLGAGASRVLSVNNGSGTFVLLGSDLAGVLTLSFNLGPAIPNLTLSATNLTLALNTSAGAVPTIDGVAVDLPGGPYYRVSGNGTMGITNVAASLTGDFVFEPRDADANTANGYEEVAVGVANLSFSFTDGANPLLNVTDGTGAFVFRTAGIVGSLTVDASLTIPDVEVTGVFGVALNNTNAAYNQNIDVNGTEVTVNVLAGPYLRVTATGNTTDADPNNDTADLAVLGILLRGNYTFERRQTTTGGEQVVTLAATNLSLDLGSAANDLISITNGTAAFIITNTGLTGASSATLSLNVPGVTLGGTFTVRVNTTNAAVNETISISGGAPVVIALPAGPYLQISGNGVTLGFLGVTLTGNFTFEQRTAASGRQLIWATASNVAFNFGTSIVTLTNGSANIFLTDGGLAGSGQITATVNAFGGLSHTFQWSFNTTGEAIDEQVNPTIDLPGGPYNTIDSGPVPIGISVNIGGYTQAMTGRFILTFVDAAPDYATVAVSSLNATVGSGTIGLQLANGAGAFVIYDGGAAGEATVATATLNGVNLVTLEAQNLKLRFNSLNADVGNPTPVIIPIDDDSAHDISLQFIGTYYRQYIGVTGTAELTLLGGDISLGGNFDFERAAFNVTGSAALEDIFKVHGSDLHFDLKAGSLSVVSFHNGSGTFVILSTGIAGVGSLEFQSGIVGLSGTLALELNTTGAAVSVVNLPTASGNVSFNLATPNYLLVKVTNGYVHLGSVALPLPSFQVLIVGSTVVLEPLGGGADYVSVDSAGNITTGLSFSDFAAPGPFEFVSMLRQAIIWLDTFRDAGIFQTEIPFTGGKDLGDVFDWSQVFLDKIFSNMVSVELQSRTLALQTDTIKSGILTNAKFKIQLGDETPVEVTVNTDIPGNPSDPTSYSNADHNLDELVDDFNYAIGLTTLAGRVTARIHKARDQIPSDPDYADRFVDDIFVIALTESEIAKGTELNLVDVDDFIAALGFGPGDGIYGDAGDTTSEQIGVLVDRYDTRHFFEVLADILNDGLVNDNGGVVYNPAQQVYTYDVEETVHYDTNDLFGVSSVPFNWNLDLGPLASASLNGSLLFGADLSLKLRIGFDLSAREVPRILSSSTVPVPANGRISEDAIFTITLNDESPIALTLDHATTTGNNSIEELAADLNQVFHNYMYSGPLVSSPTRLDQLIVAQKAGSGLAISALQETDSDNDGVPDAGKDFNGDTNTDNWLGLINRLVTVSLKNNPFATEMGFGNEVVDLDGSSVTTDDQLFVAASNSTMKGFFIDKHPDVGAQTLSASVSVTTKFNTPGNPNDQDGIYGSVRFGFVEITTNNGSFGTLAYNGTTANPLTVGISLEDRTTGETRFYLSDLFSGTASANLANMIGDPAFGGSLLARLDQISVGGLGFNFPLGPNPQISAWIPDINDLDYNPDPYNGSNTGIFLTYPTLGSLQDFTSLSFTKIIHALDAIADQLSQLSAFSFLDEPLPFVNLSVNDMIDYAQKFADLIDGAAAGGSQSSLQDTITEIEQQIEELFDLNPDILTLSLDDGGLSGLSGSVAGGVNGSVAATVLLNPSGANNAIQISTKPANLATASTFNGSVVRYIADPTITNTTAQARWDSTNKVLTVRVNSAHTTATAIVTAINGLAGSPWTATLNSADPGNTGGGAVTTSAYLATGGVNGVSQAAITLMPGGDNNNFTITSTGPLGTAAQRNGASVRLVGDSAVAGNSAQVSWDASTKVLALKINPGVTTANTIISAINAAGIPWNAALAPPDNNASGNTGNGTVTTSALKFSLVFQTAYANTLPFQLDLQDLVSGLAGNNPTVAAFLEAATTLVQISGSGNLTVSASATLTLDFGLDLSNPSSIKPFLYDSTGVELLAKVAATNVDIEASLGAVFGIFIKDGKVTLDADGNPNTDAGDGDRGASFHLGLKNNNGDGRHYFTESFFNSDNIDLSLAGGVSAQLPIFAPTESSPLGGDADANGDGYPDNYLVIEIADLMGLFLSEAVSTEADGLSKVVKFAGLNNDLNVVSNLYTDYDIIFLDSLTGNAANAAFNVGTNTLTVNIDSGATTALVARNAIQAAAGGGGHFATTALASDDDGNPDAPHANSGAGKLEKIFIVTPDFSQLFANLDFCTIITEHIGDILNGLDSLLGSIEDGLNEVVYNTDLPLIGNGLQGAANFIEDFRNGLLKSLREEVDAAGGNGAVAVENAIKKALWNTLGPDGVNLLVDYETGEALDPEAGFSQLDVTLDCDTGLIVNIRLAASLALLDTTQNPIDFAIGVPGFGLEVDGNVVVSIGFDLKFGFGFNTEDGFYFNSSAPADDPELVIEFKAEIPGLHAAGQLLFLQLDVTDDSEDPSLFRGFFEVDLMDPNHDGKLTFAELTSSGTQFTDIIHANLGAEAHVNLHLAASFGGDTAFPRVLADFHLDWVFDLDHGAGTPEISVTDIYLDLGTFISDFLAPILEKIQDVTEPLQPILDLVTARIPILSDLAGEKITLLTLAEIFGLLEPSTVDFINDVIQVITLINSLEGLGEGEILIPFGAFSLGADEDGNMTNIAALQEMAERSLDEIADAAEAATGPGASSSYTESASGFVSDAGSLHNFSIPIFDNPGELFNLFIGEPVRLVEWRMPTFKFKFTYTQKIPIYPPLYAQFGGSIGADINIGFGYDTYGIQKFISSEDKNFLDILDGFYVLDFDANGNEQPELKLTGELFAGASISLLIVEVGVKGGVSVTFEFDLNDVNDDGKVRVSEIIANAQQDPRCIFDIHGEISLFLEAYLKVDLFFFSIEKTWRFAEITLLEFDITCPEPVLATNIGSDLYLNIGSRAADREEIDTNDNSERFVVKHISGSAGNETVEVQWGNFKQQFTFTGTLIAEDAGQGDDYIDTRGVLSTVELHGGEGNDTIFLSDGDSSTAYGDGGNDTITASTQTSATNVVIMGGKGNDTLLGGPVAISISGDEDKDTITGSPEADTLLGGDGDDNITGDDGDDYIDAGAGNDIVDGNGGRDFILGGAGTDTLRGSRDDDIIDGGDGDDQIFGSSGNDLLIGGNGNDKLFGHGGIELLIGDKVSTVANLAIDYGNLDGLLTAVAAIPTAGITVKGLTGTGNDFLAGGGNVDVLFGGDGNDFMYGGNFLSTGDTEVIEEDANDFFDGGRGDDTIFGDDSMGREGIRNTGIAIKSAIWFDANLNNIRDADETGFGGVEVKLYRRSDSHLIATEETEVDGSFAFNGLDPNDYYMTFSIPTGMSLVSLYGGGGNDPEDSTTDNDASLSGSVGLTDQFNVTYGETEASISAGFTGPALVSITDQSVNEGSNGQTTVTFTVTLSHLQGYNVEIEYRTVDATATAASGDYQSVPTTVLTFAPGETSKTITVFVNGDTMYEPHEQFELDILRAQQMIPGSPLNLTVSDSLVLVTIINDDQIPTISIHDFQQAGVDDDDDPLTPPVYDENMPAHFLVTLSNPSQYTITVQWRTDASTTFQGANPDDAATPSGFAGADFLMAFGSLTFQPGETNKAFDVTVYDDSLDENVESFFVDLFNPTYADLSDDRAYGLIADDDAPVSVYIVPAAPIDAAHPFTTQIAEGNAGTQSLKFFVKLSAASGKTISVTYATSPGTAVESVFSGSGDPVDYQTTPNDSTLDALTTLVFEPGDPLSITISVLVNGDTVVEGEVNPDNPAQLIEQFFVNILSADNADIAANPLLTQSNHSTVNIVDDDLITTDAGPWSIYFSATNYFVDEPASGDGYAYVDIMRTPGSTNPVGVFYTTNGTATAGADYDAVFRQVVYFSGNETKKTVAIKIHSDATTEGTESVRLWLRNPTGGPVRASPDTATLRILDGDAPEFAFQTSSLTFTEGSGGGTVTKNIVVQLRDAVSHLVLNAADQQSTVTVKYTIVNLTARQPSDYNYAPGFPVTGTLTFIPGDVSETISVNIVKDNLAELSETFAIQLSNPLGGVLAQNGEAAIVTIVDDDLTPIIGYVFYDNNGNGFKDVNEKGVKDVSVEVTYMNGTTPVPVTVLTNSSGLYTANVLLGQVNIAVDGTTVTSPYKDIFWLFLGSGDYETTTDNENQTVQFKGIVGLSPFTDIGYRNTFTFDLPSDASDSGRGGTDDMIFGGPGNDVIDAGAGDDHVVGGHWMTATDENAPINDGADGAASYNAVITVQTSSLHPVYDTGPIFDVNTTSADAGLNANGKISGEIWVDNNTNGRQDAGEPLFTELVFVNLYDCNGNPVNTVVTSTSQYTFTGLYLKSGEDSDYVVEFVLPHDYAFSAHVAAIPAGVNQDVIVGGRTSMVTLNTGAPSATDIDAGVKGSGNARLQVTGGFRFSEPSYSVAENVEDGILTIEVKRTNSFLQRAVVVKTFDGTAIAGVNYTALTALLLFDVGETVKTLDIQIIDTGLLGICVDPLTINLELRDVTGRPYDTAVVYLGGDSFGNIPDDDTIEGGADWDILLGDSGHIPSPTVIDPNPPYNNLSGIVYSGGPGMDTINGGDGPDFINGQLFNDTIAGNEGEDQIEAGLGDDTIIVELDDDTINGDYGFDTVISSRDVAKMVLNGTVISATLEHFNSAGDSLSTFSLTSVESARIYGGGMRNTIELIGWDGDAIISGGGNTDSLSVEIDTDMILKNATLIEGLLYSALFGFFKDSALSLANGATFHLGSLEKVTITGGPSANVINASAYSRPVTLIGKAGNDTLIGGSAADTFIFDADSVLGTDTVTGNGGADTLNFAQTTGTGVVVDLANHASQTVVAGKLNLILTDDLENATGGSGDDFLYGNGLNNVLLGGPGNDWLEGRAGDETYVFDTDSPWGSETVVENIADSGHDILDFSGTTTRKINLNMLLLNVAQIVNTNLTLTLNGEGVEEVIGGSLNDTILGNGNNNTLRGGPGQDVLSGKNGDDVLDGGSGNDDLDGGDGTDTINEIADTDFTLTNNSLTRGTGEVDKLNNIEVANLVGGVGENTFTLTGWTGSGSIDGADDPNDPKDDTLIVAADANFTLTDSSLSISINLGPIALATFTNPMPSPHTAPTIDLVQLTDGDGNHTLDASGYSGETLLTGGNGNDILIGGSGHDTLRGGLGSDTLTGNRSNDVLDGGTGTDTVVESLSTFAGTVDFVIQNNLFVIVQNDPNPAPPDETVTESDVLIGIENATITGSGQDDTFDVTGWVTGSLTVNGGAGSDTLQSTAPGEGTLTLTNTGISFAGTSGTSSATLAFNSIDVVYLYGSSGDDVIDASAYSGAAALVGNEGDDILKGGLGLNLLDGGDGDDRFVFRPGGVAGTDRDFVAGGDGEDTLDFSAFNVAVTINLASFALQNVVAGGLQVALISLPGPTVEEIENVIGGSAGDTLTGNALDNRITGGGGADTISGGGGTNTVVETADADMLLTNVSLTIGALGDILANIQHAELTGGASGNTIDASAFTQGSVILSGLGGNDRLIGGADGDTLIGGANNDLLRGMGGNDTYLFDADQVLGDDVVDESAGPAGGVDFLDFRETQTVGVTVDLSVTTQQTVHATNFRLTLTSGASVEYLAGGDRDDTLIGNGLDNAFIGGLGNDIIRGGAGLNYLVETREDVVGHEEDDFTLASTGATTASLAIGADNDALTDIQFVLLTAGSGNNTMDASQFNATGGAVILHGGAGDDTLLGSYGDDALYGDDGDDVLYGNAGADYLNGGAGEDTLSGAGSFDLLLGTDGNDWLEGGDDSDLYIFDQSFQQGSDTITERRGGGAHDTLQGVGIAGIDVNLYLATPQIISANLTLTLNYPVLPPTFPNDLGQIEHSF